MSNYLRKRTGDEVVVGGMGITAVMGLSPLSTPRSAVVLEFQPRIFIVLALPLILSLQKTQELKEICNIYIYIYKKNMQKIKWYNPTER